MAAKEISVTPAAAKAKRAELGCSLREARVLVLRDLLLQALKEAETVEDLKPIIEAVIKQAVK